MALMRRAYGINRLWDDSLVAHVFIITICLHDSVGVPYSKACTTLQSLTLTPPRSPNLANMFSTEIPCRIFPSSDICFRFMSPPGWVGKITSINCSPSLMFK
ncbi:hypothetical protein HanIR_Chr17g0866991 [Helianthus annuus]|nr:hypothetical protein HanIR_Chr17g0866991 [Helianthus annuus]